MEELSPPILRGGEVERCCDDAEEEPHQPGSRDHRPNHPHGQDDSHVCTVQYQPAGKLSEQRNRGCEDEIRDEQRHRVVADVHTRCVDDVFSVGDPKVDPSQIAIDLGQTSNHPKDSNLLDGF